MNFIQIEHSLSNCEIKLSIEKNNLLVFTHMSIFGNNFLSDFLANRRKINRVEWIAISSQPNENIIIGHKSDFFIYSVYFSLSNGQSDLILHLDKNWPADSSVSWVWQKFWKIFQYFFEKKSKKILRVKNFERKNRQMVYNFENFRIES